MLGLHRLRPERVEMRGKRVTDVLDGQVGLSGGAGCPTGSNIRPFLGRKTIES